jgi:O-antigen/teichoic acid export membrane protein
MLSFLPILLTLFDSEAVFLRSLFLNKQYSILSFVASTFALLLPTIGAFISGITGVIYGKYISVVSSLYLGVKLIKRTYNGNEITESIPSSKKKEFLVFALTAMLTNSISSLLYKIDTFLVGTLIKTAEAVASYSIATQIPYNLNFIPLVLMTFAYPYFVKNWKNIHWVRKHYRLITLSLALLNSSLCITLFFLAPQTIKLFFGERYLVSTPIFKILIFGYFIAGTFRIPSGNLLAALGKIKVNLVNSIISGITNILLDLVMIYFFGALGAAIATVIVFILSSLISFIYLYRYLWSRKVKI